MDNIFSDLRSDIQAHDNVKPFYEKKLAIEWLWPGQKYALDEYYNPEMDYQDMVLVIGMRGGKTTIASVCACYEAYKLISVGSPCKLYGLPRGTEIFIVNVATSSLQAKDTVFAHIKARIDNSPWFQKQEYIEHFNEYIFQVDDGRVIIRSEHSNSASLAGKTVICAIFDELSRFRDTSGNSSAGLVYDTLSRSVKTFGKSGRRIAISSPMLNDDYHMRLYRFGKPVENKKVFTMHKPTWEMNPNITFESLADEFEKNPETAWRDYGAIPSAAIEAYMKEHAKIDMCVNPELVNAFKVDGFNIVLNNEWEPIDSTPYVLAGDPALKNDAFGFCLLHQDAGMTIVDGVGRFTPDLTAEAREIDAAKVRELVVNIKDNCWLTTFVLDTWMFPETVQGIRRAGVDVVNNVVKKEQYDYLKEKIYTLTIQWPEYDILPLELKGLELVRSQKVDHPRGGSKDVSDSVANATWLTHEMIGYEEPIMVMV